MPEAFVDDDTGYVGWIAIHPRGFVLNALRSLGEEYLMVHTSRCRTITGKPARGEHWTDQYIKVCAVEREELASWLRARFGRDESKSCELCLG